MCCENYCTYSLVYIWNHFCCGHTWSGFAGSLLLHKFNFSRYYCQPYLQSSFINFTTTSWLSISIAPHRCQHLLLSAIFRLAILVKACKCDILALACTSLIINEVEYLVMCVLVICLSSSCEVSVQVLCLKCYELVYLIKIALYGFFIYSGHKYFVQYKNLNVFFSLWSPLHSLNGIFGWTEVTNFNFNVQLVMFSLSG